MVADYLAMLASELGGESYNKAAHNRALQRVLGRRTDGSIERKHQNISAVLIDLGFPYIERARAGGRVRDGGSMIANASTHGVELSPSSWCCEFSNGICKRARLASSAGLSLEAPAKDLYLVIINPLTTQVNATYKLGCLSLKDRWPTTR